MRAVTLSLPFLVMWACQRNMVLVSAKDLRRPEAEALIRSAEKTAMVPLKALRRGDLIMKDSTPGKKPKRTAAKR